MATPKKRTSVGHKGRRRSHHHLDKPNVIRCGVSGAAKLSHRICDESGYYGKNKKVLEVKETL